MKKASVTLLCLVSFVMMSFLFIKETAPRYKNLKILPKNISKQQMDSVMHHFTASLNVKCGYCHSYNAEQKSMDFASDIKKEKNIARSMWRMTAKLNKKYFEVKDSKDLGAKLEVTCFTCHHGAEDPETKAPARKMGPPQGLPSGGGASGQIMPASGDSVKHN